MIQYTLNTHKQLTLYIIDDVFFSLIEDLDEREILVVRVIETFILSLVMAHTSVEVFDGGNFIGTHIIRTRHFHLLHAQPCAQVPIKNRKISAWIEICC